MCIVSHMCKCGTLRNNSRTETITKIMKTLATTQLVFSLSLLKMGRKNNEHLSESKSTVLRKTFRFINNKTHDNNSIAEMIWIFGFLRLQKYTLSLSCSHIDIKTNFPLILIFFQKKCGMNLRVHLKKKPGSHLFHCQTHGQGWRPEALSQTGRASCGGMPCHWILTDVATSAHRSW